MSARAAIVSTARVFSTTAGACCHGTIAWGRSSSPPPGRFGATCLKTFHAATSAFLHHLLAIAVAKTVSMRLRVERALEWVPRSHSG